MQERWKNQLKMLGEIAAPKFPRKHAVKFIVWRYEGLSAATETKITMGFSKEFSNIFGTATFENICEGLEEKKGVKCLLWFQGSIFFSAIIHKLLNNILSLQTFQVFAFLQFKLCTQ